MKKHIYIIAGIIVAAGMLAMPGQAYENIKINNDQTTQIQNEQQIIANPMNPDNVVAVWRDFRLGYRQVGIGTSFDGGFTWSQQLVVDTHYGWQSDPGVTVDASGNFYIIFLSYTSTSDPNGLFIQKSTDGGLTWGDSITVVDGEPSYFEDKELMACDRTGGTYNGNLYVTWARFYTTSIMCSRSVDNGASFESPVTLESGSLQWPVPAVGPNGEVYIAWENFSSGMRISRSDNGGASFGTIHTVDANADFYGDINGGVTVFSYPAMDVDISGGTYNGRVYIAYMADSASNGTEMYHRYSDDGGTTWSSRVRLNDDATGQEIDQFHPWLAVNPDTGEIAVMFYDRRNDPANLLMDVYWTRSTDGGASWTPNERITTVSSDPTAGKRSQFPNRFPENGRAGLIGEYNGLCSAGSGWNMVWTDTREGNQDTYTAPIREITPSPSPSATASPTPDMTYTPPTNTPPPFTPTPSATATPTPDMTYTPPTHTPVQPTSTPVPPTITHTPSPTPTPVDPHPTWTPYPTWTPSPTPPPTLPPTQTPVNTPTATPSAPPTPELGLKINLSDSCFEPGDYFDLTVTLYNTTPDPISDVPFFVLLDVYGLYFWWPGWTESFQYDMVDLLEPLSIMTILQFTWPAINDSATGVLFHTAMTTPDMSALLSEDSYDFASFGWAPAGECP
jgi:hypothetical protein